MLSNGLIDTIQQGGYIMTGEEFAKRLTWLRLQKDVSARDMSLSIRI